MSDVHIRTFNVRYDTDDEYPWADRRSAVVETIERIDYVFVSGAIDVQRYRTLSPAEGVSRSDHLPVTVEIGANGQPEL